MTNRIDNSTSRRLHWTTITFGLMLAFLMVAINLPIRFVATDVQRVGYGHISQPSPPLSSLPTLGRHTLQRGGFPWAYYQRSEKPLEDMSPTESGAMIAWSWMVLLADMAIAVAILLVACGWWQWQWTRRKRLLQIMLGDILLLVAVVALPMAWWRWEQDRYQREQEVIGHDGVVEVVLCTRIPEFIDSWDLIEPPRFLDTPIHIHWTDPDSDAIREISQMRSLERIVLFGGDYAADDLAWLKQLPLLSSLTLKDAAAANDVCRHIASLKRLKSLKLIKSPIEDQSVPMLTSLRDLRVLDLSDTSVTDECFVDLAQLRELRLLTLRSNPVDGTGLGHFDRHPNLQDLVLGIASEEKPGRMKSVDLRGLPRLRKIQVPAMVDRIRLHDLPSLEALVAMDMYAWTNEENPISATEVSFVDLPSLKRLSVYAPALRTFEIRGLTSIYRLYLSSYSYRNHGVEKAYRLSKGLLEQIGRMDTLQELWLPQSEFDNLDISPLSSLTNLQSLMLGDSSLNDIGVKNFSGMSDLRDIDFSNTAVTDVGWSTLPVMPNLRWLSLRGTKISNIDLRDLKDFENLDVLGTPLKTIRLVNLPSYVYGVSLSDCPLEEIELVNLPMVHLIRVTQVQPRRWAIGGLDNLTVLDFSDTNVDERTLLRFADSKSISTIRLNNTPITDKALEVIGGWSSMTSIDLENTSVTDDGLKHLANLPQLERLNMTGTPITDRGLKHLRKMSSLELLYLGRTNVTGTGLHHLKDLQHLRKLSLGETPANTKSLADLPKLRRLVWLRLSDTEADDETMDLVVQLPRLNSLMINGCNVTDTGIGKLKTRRLELLDVCDTLISSEAISWMRQSYYYRQLETGTRSSGELTP